MNIALILSGGIGNRIGAEIPKQYIEVRGKPVISYCLNTFAECMEIDGIQIVADTGWREFIQEKMCGETGERDYRIKFKGFSKPGGNRQISILHGLEDIASYAGKDAAVVVHDAVRPCVRTELILECLNAVKVHDGVVPVIPMKDTVYESMDGRRISSLLNRECIFAGQAPEAFRLAKYLEANRRLWPEDIMEINGATEPAVMAGMDIAMISGDEDNFKITTKADLERFQRLQGRSGK